MTVPSSSVTVVTSEVVRCANNASYETLSSPFRLGPLDTLVAPFIPVAAVFVYRQLGDSAPPREELIPLPRLRLALTRLLDCYPHLTGRLQLNPDGSREIVRVGTGAELFEARSDLRLDDLADQGGGSSGSGRVRMVDLPDAGNAFMAPFDMSVEAVCAGPPLTIQHTRLACGSVALGVRVLHTLCDAEGCFQMVRHLAEIYRQLSPGAGARDLASTSLRQPPTVEGYMADLELSPEERQTALEYDPILYHVEPTPTAAAEPPPPPQPAEHPPPPVVGRFLRYSGDSLKRLKAAASDSDDQTSWISTFDALAAHLYQRIYRARVQIYGDGGEMSPPDILTPVNLRNRLGEGGLPPQYFPNGLLTVYTSVPTETLAAAPLHRIASALHDLTRHPSVTSRDALDRTLRWMVAQPDRSKIQWGFRGGNGCLMISQWNKMDMYAGATFEAPPVLASTPFTEISLIDGLGYFLPTEAQGIGGDAGEIEVCMALAGPVWEVLDRDEEFTQYLSRSS
ncbi:hypothetical protein EHS25_000621 [Saitozyma podzolica]|uniref:Uncharacterized protein n=1 Tax=Saitozyma podzolica TaxID=1890683 RepID=A0A427YWR7_9TREE|nr:hypothetical protein EHS25_000621 [Saitozyma podzolica]